jgi:hypothetical protein
VLVENLKVELVRPPVAVRVSMRAGRERTVASVLFGFCVHGFLHVFGIFLGLFLLANDGFPELLRTGAAALVGRLVGRDFRRWSGDACGQGGRLF